MRGGPLDEIKLPKGAHQESAGAKLSQPWLLVFMLLMVDPYSRVCCFCVGSLENVRSFGGDLKMAPSKRGHFEIPSKRTQQNLNIFFWCVCVSFGPRLVRSEMSLEQRSGISRQKPRRQLAFFLGSDDSRISEDSPHCWKE